MRMCVYIGAYVCVMAMRFGATFERTGSSLFFVRSLLPLHGSFSPSLVSFHCVPFLVIRGLRIFTVLCLCSYALLLPSLLCCVRRIVFTRIQRTKRG